MGRKTSYRTEYDEQAFKLCLLGATDKQLADFFGVTEQAINIWKTKYPSFFESLKRGKQQADAEVAKSLYRNALGYEHQEEQVFVDRMGNEHIVTVTKRYAPNPTSCIFWLKNRQPERWRDQQGAGTFELPDGYEITIGRDKTNKD